MALTALVVDVRGRDADGLSEALLEAGALSVSCEETCSQERGADIIEASGPASWPLVRLTALCRSEHGKIVSRACAAAGVAIYSHPPIGIPDEDWVARSRSARD